MIYVEKEFLLKITNTISHFFSDMFFPSIKVILLYPFAKMGIVSAQLDIAQIYLENFFCRTMKIPKKWLKKGIQQKNPRAYVIMGRFRYCQGSGYYVDVDKDYAVIDDKLVFCKALSWFKKAAAQNYAIAQYWIYQIHYYKEYCDWKTDGTKELALAAKNGCPNAQFCYARKFLESDNVEEGSYWMKKAASQPKREWKKCETNPQFYYKAKKWVKNNKDIIQNHREFYN